MTKFHQSVVEHRVGELCEICGHKIITSAPFYDHRDVCDYNVFNDNASQAGLVSLSYELHAADGRDAEFYLLMLERLNIKHTTFTINSHFNRGLIIFVDQAIADAIALYNSKGGFGETTVEEFVQRMCLDSPP